MRDKLRDKKTELSELACTHTDNILKARDGSLRQNLHLVCPHTHTRRQPSSLLHLQAIYSHIQVGVDSAADLCSKTVHRGDMARLSAVTDTSKQSKNLQIQTICT